MVTVSVVSESDLMEGSHFFVDKLGNWLSGNNGSLNWNMGSDGFVNDMHVGGIVTIDAADAADAVVGVDIRRGVVTVVSVVCRV